MHLQGSVQFPDDSRVWTHHELKGRLRKVYANRSLLIPDDDLYASLNKKEALEALGATIERQLKIRRNVRYVFSSKITAPGIARIDTNPVTVTIPSIVIGKPIIAAAYLSHLLAHISLYEHRILHVDPAEQERLADLATITSGLGLLVANGMRRGGWRSLFNSTTKSDSLGYYRPNSYTEELKKHLPLSDRSAVAAALVPWERKQLVTATRTRNTPLALQRAANFHYRSFRRAFLFLFALFIVLLVAATLKTSPRQTYADSRLRELRSSAAELENTYQHCKIRLADLRTSLPDDYTKERVLSAEEGKCKSLENRYNSAAEQYNHYLKYNND